MKKKMSKKKTEKPVVALTLEERILAIPFWYHKIELPDGVVTPGCSPILARKYGIPDDMTGKRVLDIGAWDGYWTWEALKRGASEVVAIDDFSDNLGSLTKEQRLMWEPFDLCREELGFKEYGADPMGTTITDKAVIQSAIEGGWVNDKGQRVCRIQMSVYDIERLGHFDIVFFFGTIYHLKHPYKALEIISDICDGEIYIESAICDDFSPYRGGLNKGYANNDMVMEFYPEDQYARNENNWWVPTLQCLGKMVESVGFKGIGAWALTPKPTVAPHLRGFVCGSKSGSINPNCIRLMQEEAGSFPKPLNVAAVMSVPRLGFMDNHFCVIQGIVKYQIPIINMQGALWGQCLERGMENQIDTGADVILTIDYDTVFTPEDIGELIRLMTEHPEADAIVPVHVGRNEMASLMSVKSPSGRLRKCVPKEEFEPELTRIFSGHFGLTMLRTSALLKMPHPWFLGVPNSDGRWEEGRIDDDIYFWKKMEDCGLNVYSANRVTLGHLELMVSWPSSDLQSVHQSVKDYKSNGKPENIWR